MPRDIWTPGSAATSNPFIVLPDGWNTVWAAAKAAAASSPAWITIIGDSISISQNASTLNKGWHEVLLATLLANTGLPKYADYFPCFGESPVGYAGSGLPWSGALNSVTVNTVANYETFSGWHRTWGVNTGGTAVYHQRFTVPYACASLDIYSFDDLSGTFKYSVNGGVDQTITHTGGNSQAASSVRRTHIAGPFNPGDTVDIGKQSSAGVALIGGIACNVGSTGIGLATLSGQNQRLTDYDETQGGFPTNRLGLFSGRSDQAAGTLGANGTPTFTWGYPLQGHLHIICIGANDCFFAANQSLFQNDLDQLITAIRRGRRNGSILLVVPAYPQGQYTDCGIIQPPTAAPTVVAGSGTLVGGSTYQYAVAYGSIYGDTTIGPATGNQTGQTGYNLTFAAAPAGTDHISIYRNIAAGAFTLIAQNSTPGATTYNDTGAAAGAAAPGSNLSVITNYANWRSFMEYIREAARQYNCGLVNIHAKWGSDPFAQGLMGSSPNVHPTDAGFADIAATIAGIL